jgi:hypothetical protein
MSGSTSAAAPDPDRDASREDQTADASGSSSTVPSGDQRGAGGPTADRPPASQQTTERPPPGVRAGPDSAAGTHGQFLITSDERDRAEARLRQAVADEVLSLEEFGDRMHLLLVARTRAELHEAVAGLPADREPAARVVAPGQQRPAREQGSVIAILGSAEAAGRWRPAHSTTVVAALGEAKVDLQGAEYTDDELVINAFAALGSVEIIVPEGVEVDLRGIAVLGERKLQTGDTVVPGSPVVRVEGLAVLGDITVRHPRARERHAPSDGRGAFADRVPLQPAVRAQGSRGRAAVRRPIVRHWVAGLLTAVALALPLGWVLSSDDVAGAVFGSTQQAVAVEQLAAGDETTVGVPMAFGSVTLEVPDDVNVERDGLVVFGSCEGCGARAVGDAPTVRIRTLGAFGSVEVVRVPAVD